MRSAAARQTVVFAFVIALGFTLFLNAWTLVRLAGGQVNISYLNDNYIDDRFYFSTIAKVGHGQPALGHSSYLEHRGDRAPVTLAPVLEGLMMRWSGLPLTATVLLGDLLFPFLALFLLTLGLIPFLRGSRIAAGAAALAIGCDIGLAWFRASNPQVPFVAVGLWLAATLALPRDTRNAFARGAILGCLTWVQVVYASFFLVADAALFADDLLAHRSPPRVLRDGLAYGAGLLLLVFPRFLLPSPPDVSQDTFYRLGIIRDHLPSGPGWQAILLLLVVALLAAWKWKRQWMTQGIRRCLVLLAASVLALNLPVFTGFDAVFVSYYSGLLRILLILTAASAVVSVIPREQWKKWMFAGWALCSLLSFATALAAQDSAAAARAAEFAGSDTARVLAWLQAQPGPLVVASPKPLNEWIPSQTPQYDLFNEYGWNLPMTDTELARRYALQASLIPSSRAKDATYTVVFGGFAGLTAAKERTFCRMKDALLRAHDDCAVDAPPLIRHQELLPVVDHLRIDAAEAMKDFHVSMVITDGNDLTPDVEKFCAQDRVIGSFTVWRCHP